MSKAKKAVWTVISLFLIVGALFELFSAVDWDEYFINTTHALYMICVTYFTTGVLILLRVYGVIGNKECGCAKGKKFFKSPKKIILAVIGLLSMVGGIWAALYGSSTVPITVYHVCKHMICFVCIVTGIVIVLRVFGIFGYIKDDCKEEKTTAAQCETNDCGGKPTEE